MVKPELGTKRVCVACGTKFYDLTRTPAVCPKCGTEQPAEQPRLRRPAAPVDDKLRKRAVTPGTEAETDETDLEDADTDTGLEDAEDLEDADEDLGEEIGVESESDEEG
ncbi:MAG: TIGR02300 family protein [Azospirillum brasilense]|uniref:TIGR02300 family protein n=1 Tax=Roseomonas gilardii TaxID=257708 RepID=A0A1L7AJH5_9PROT|nr:TIGR02300 family protein [Roseomonas gilardii]APT58945.1 TIGR02300 family protein [Roseomonas gilardii]MDT8333492.1 TIGR02300 family protein [Roseomonas gilardii]PZP40233.1 MAG: TIGR02300 family protein [Azospirillum brasilense]PZR08321.1 MAG: TIGR02300 family protein [Azospirillum brasilense]